MSSKLKPCSHGFYSHHNCSDDAKAFQPPNCPCCGRPLEWVYENFGESYKWDSAAGRYKEGSEDGEVKCSECGAQVADVLPNGACNYDARHGKTTKDYLYCETCKGFVDFWKYGHDLSAAGHEGHRTREVTEEEFRQCLKDCEEDGCFVE